MKNVRLYANYNGRNKIIVDMRNKVYDINYGKMINFLIVDLFQLIVCTVFGFNMK